MKLFKKYFFLLLFSGSGHCLFSQENPNENSELDKKYKPNSIFEDGKEQKAGAAPFDEATAAIRFKPFGLVRGFVLGEGEVNVFGNANLIVGFGYKIGGGYNFPNLNLFDDYSSGNLGFKDATNQSEFKSGGTYISLGLKMYADGFQGLNRFNRGGEPFDDAYTVIDFSRSSWHRQLYETVNGLQVEGDGDFRVVHYTITYGIGYSFFSNGSRLIHDVYLTVQFNHFEFTNYSRHYSPSSYVYPGNETYYKKGTNDTQTFMPMIGYSIGFAF